MCRNKLCEMWFKANGKKASRRSEGVHLTLIPVSNSRASNSKHITHGSILIIILFRFMFHDCYQNSMHVILYSSELSSVLSLSLVYMGNPAGRHSEQPQHKLWFRFVHHMSWRDPTQINWQAKAAAKSQSKMLTTDTRRITSKDTRFELDMMWRQDKAEVRVPKLLTMTKWLSISAIVANALGIPRSCSCSCYSFYQKKERFWLLQPPFRARVAALKKEHAARLQLLLALGAFFKCAGILFRARVITNK